MNRPSRVPSYRLHKGSGQAIVTIGGKMFYLGRFGSVESRAEYNRLIAESLALGPGVSPPSRSAASSHPADLTIAELVNRYRQHAAAYYTKNGRPTSEVDLIRLACRPILHLYGDTIARDFGPLGLKAVRQQFIDDGLCRNEVNRRTRLIVQMFKWAVANEMIPPMVHHGLKAVEGLRRGRSGVRESPPVKPVPEAFVDAVLPHVSRQVAAMIELQRFSGMRPGEVVIMRTIDIDTSGRVWIYTPESHKTEHHGRERRIYLGPKAIEALKPWLRVELDAYLFSPREAMAERSATLRAARKTKVQPSQGGRRKGRGERSIGERYARLSYALAITRGCDRAFPHPTLSPRTVDDLSPEERKRHRDLRRLLRRKDLSPERREELKAAVNSLLRQALTDEQRDELDAWRKAHRWHPNQLRHNAATRLRREFGLEVAKAVLGHSSVMPTQIYAEQDQAAAVDAMLRVG